MQDLYSGCFEGAIFFLAGKKEGGYEKLTPLLDKEGDLLRLGKYWHNEDRKWTTVQTSECKGYLGISASAVDWDEDGDLDLILGSNEGRIFLNLNEGGSGKPIFAVQSQPILVDSETMYVGSKGAMPVVADWDGDGRWDLVSGSDAGGVVWFRNTGKKGKPAFCAAETLVERSGSRSGDKVWPGPRTLVYVADYDADGDLDLLIGDNSSLRDKNGRSTRHGWVWLVRRK